MTRARVAFLVGFLALGLGGCDPMRPAQSAQDPWPQVWMGDLSNAAFQHQLADLDPAARALAARTDPGRHPRLWGRPLGWSAYDIDRATSLGLTGADPADARRINALIPRASLPNPAARPFVLRASTGDRARAEHCLAQAVYFEAASESAQGQAAVAQTVLNRLRHPDFPKSVCGVVYQGARLATGCQFSFTCDGSLARGVDNAAWARAQAIARRALDGYVEPSIGWATHYHADYVTPYWGPTLVKLIQIGAHIFYRWPGPAGAPDAFVGRYAGHEDVLPPALLTAGDPAALLADAVQTHQDRTVTLAVAGQVSTYTVADPHARGGAKTRVAGVIIPARPEPEQAISPSPQAAAGP
jgi:spore germination cell wall hydrolase CwlJ-like protein